MPEPECKRQRQGSIHKHPVSDFFETALSFADRYNVDPESLEDAESDLLYEFMGKNINITQDKHQAMLDSDILLQEIFDLFASDQEIDLGLIIYFLLHSELYITIHNTTSESHLNAIADYIKSDKYGLSSKKSFMTKCLQLIDSKKAEAEHRAAAEIYQMSYLERQKYIIKNEGRSLDLARSLQNSIQIARRSEDFVDFSLNELTMALSSTVRKFKSMHEEDHYDHNFSILIDKSDRMFQLIIQRLRVGYADALRNYQANILEHVAEIIDLIAELTSTFAVFPVGCLKGHKVGALSWHTINYVALSLAIAYEGSNILLNKRAVTKRPPPQLMRTVTRERSDSELIIEYHQKLIQALYNCKPETMTISSKTSASLWKTLAHNWLFVGLQALYLISNHPNDEESFRDSAEHYVGGLVKNVMEITESFLKLSTQMQMDCSILRDCVETTLINVLTIFTRKRLGRLTTDEIRQFLQSLNALQGILHDRPLSEFLKLVRKIESEYCVRLMGELKMNESASEITESVKVARIISEDSLRVIDNVATGHEQLSGWYRQKLDEYRRLFPIGDEEVHVAASKSGTVNDVKIFQLYYAKSLESAEILADSFHMKLQKTINEEEQMVEEDLTPSRPATPRS